VPSTQTIESHTRGRVRIDSSDVYTCWLHLLFCLRRLGVPFIGTRGLGAVGSNPGKQILSSVGWRTGQSGAHRTLSGARFLSFYSEADRWQSWSRWRTGHVRCTPDSPVPHLTVGSSTCHARIARPTVAQADRWLTGQSGVHQTVR
jgi:hypothetical protein